MTDLQLALNVATWVIAAVFMLHIVLRIARGRAVAWLAWPSRGLILLGWSAAAVATARVVLNPNVPNRLGVAAWVVIAVGLMWARWWLQRLRSRALDVLIELLATPPCEEVDDDRRRRDSDGA